MGSLSYDDTQISDRRQPDGSVTGVGGKTTGWFSLNTRGLRKWVSWRLAFCGRDSKSGHGSLTNRVGAGNAVKIGDSGAAVTGYERPIATRESGKAGQ